MSFRLTRAIPLLFKQGVGGWLGEAATCPNFQVVGCARLLLLSTSRYF